MQLSTENFENLLCLTRSMIQKQDTNMWMALPAKLKLEITLCFLATGDSFKSIVFVQSTKMYNFKIFAQIS
jgi:hypothetical protein